MFSKSMSRRSNPTNEEEELYPAPNTYSPQLYNSNSNNTAKWRKPTPPTSTPASNTTHLAPTHRRTTTPANSTNNSANSVFASKVTRDPTHTWLKPPESINTPYFLNPEKTLLNFGYYNTAPQWGRSKSPRMMVHDYIRGEMGTLSSGPQSYRDPNEVWKDEKSTETYAAFRPGNPRSSNTLREDKLQFRCPTRNEKVRHLLGRQHLAFDSVTFSSTTEWVKEVTKNHDDVRTERRRTMHRQNKNSNRTASVLPEWLQKKMYGTGSNSTTVANSSSKTLATAKTLPKKSSFSSFSSFSSTPAPEQQQAASQQYILTLFNTLPHKRDLKLVRKGAMWLRNTTIGHALTPLVRERLASGCKLIHIHPDAVLSAQIHSERRDKLPPYVYIVLVGLLKQKCKQRMFEIMLSNGDCACELPLIDPVLSQDVVTVVGGPSGATVLSIPRALYVETARSARRQMLQKRIAALQCSELFAKLDFVTLARLALSAKSKQTKNGECVMKQDEPVNSLMVVVRGSFVCGRCLLQQGENLCPTPITVPRQRGQAQVQGRTTPHQGHQGHQEQQWTRMKRTITPCTTVGHHKRGGYVGEESLFPSFLTTLGASVVQTIGSSGGGGGEQAKATVVVLDSNIAWSTVVCDGPGEVLIITPSLLKVVGVTHHKNIFNIISTNATQRPLDHVIMRRLNFRQELQRLKKKLIGDELPI